MARQILPLIVMVLLCSFPAPARSQPDGGVAPPRRLSKIELKRFRQIMAEAVKAAKKGKHAAAMAAYDRALAIKPDDQAALTDQGWSAFQLRVYDRAEAITRRAIAAEGTDRRAAAAQYNLGRILEARGDRDGAIAAYVSSLEIRPNRVVREQLAKLDPAAAAQMDPLKPTDMLGPFARLEDFCKTREERDRGGCPTPKPDVAPAKLVPPYHAVSWIQAGGQCFVAMKLGRGWFVEPRGMGCEEDAEWRMLAVSLELTQLVPGGNPEVVLATTTEDFELELNDEGFVKSYPKSCTGALLVCGVPDKDVPRCLSLQTGGASYCGTGWTWQLEPVFSAGNQLEVKGTGNLDADARALTGRRKLVFP